MIGYTLQWFYLESKLRRGISTKEAVTKPLSSRRPRGSVLTLAVRRKVGRLQYVIHRLGFVAALTLMIVLVDYKGIYLIFSYTVHNALFELSAALLFTCGVWVIYVLLVVLYTSLNFRIPKKLTWSLSIIVILLFAMVVLLLCLRVAYNDGEWIDALGNIWLAFVVVYFGILLHVNAFYLHRLVKRTTISLESASVSRSPAAQGKLRHAMNRLKIFQIAATVILLFVGPFFLLLAVDKFKYDAPPAPDPNTYEFNPFVHACVASLAMLLWYSWIPLKTSSITTLLTNVIASAESKS